MIQEDIDGTFTDMAFGAAQGQQMPVGQAPQGPRHGLYVTFDMKAVEDPEATLKAGRPIHKEVAYVTIMVPGDKGSIVHRPVRLGSNEKHDNNRFFHEYTAFIQRKAAPVVGTLLSDWNDVNAAVVLDLQHLGIRTVEDVADLNDSSLSQYMGLSDLKTKAKKFLAASAASAPKKQLEAELKERDNKIATQDEAIAEMQKTIAELKAKG